MKGGYEGKKGVRGMDGAPLKRTPRSMMDHPQLMSKVQRNKSGTRTSPRGIKLGKLGHANG